MGCSDGRHMETQWKPNGDVWPLTGLAMCNWIKSGSNSEDFVSGASVSARGAGLHGRTADVSSAQLMNQHVSMNIENVHMCPYLSTRQK